MLGQLRLIRHMGLFVALTIPSLASAMSVSLNASTPSPAPFGTLVTFTASVDGASKGTLWYRFRFHGYGQDSRLIKDYGPDSSVVWTATDHEGPYEVDVDVRNVGTGESAS